MDGRCRRHSEHRQSKGVCPFCLREKLTHLSTPPPSTAAATTIDIGASTATTSASGNSSAPDDPSNPHHVDAAGKLQSLKPLTLRKSRSLAFVFRKRKEGDKAAGKQIANEVVDGGGKKVQEATDNDKKKHKKKKKKIKNSGSFWSALISGGSERRKQKVDGGLLHSMTVKEKRADKWVIF